MSWREIAILLALIWLLACAVCFGAGRKANPEVHSVVWMETERGGILLGGSMAGRWLPAARLARRLRGGERYRLYSDHAYLREAVGTKPYDAGMNPFFVDLRPGDERCSIAIAGSWNAMPRKAKTQSIIQKIYIAAARDVLRRHGLRRAPVHIKKVLRVDLEGDGRDEVLIAAESQDYEHVWYKKGQYSLVILRKLVKGNIRTFLLGGDFHVRGTPAPKPREDAPDWPVGYDVDGFWDVDGDGALEIAVHWSCQLADAGGEKVFNIKSGKPRLLADAGVRL